MPRKLNLLLITADSLRADAVGWGARHVGSSPTPHLDRLAEEALVFTQGIAQGTYTMMSMPALLAGAAPSRLRPYSFGEEGGVLLGPNATLPEAAVEAGYRTAGFHSNPYLSRAFGFERGFETFYDDVLLGQSRYQIKAHMLIYRLRRLIRFWPYLPARGLNRKVLSWLGQGDEPFFLWVHYMDTHGPYQSSAEFNLAARIRDEALWRKAVRRPEALSAPERAGFAGAYRRAVTNLDREVGDFLEEFERRGWRDRTAVLFTADHGEEFFEHGRFGHSNAPYEELIRVPLTVCVPGVSARTIDAVVSLVDVAPTVVDIMGGAAPPHFEGQSLLRFATVARPQLESVAIVEQTLAPYVAAVRTREWKFILGDTGRRELYALGTDPGEARNVVGEHSGVAQGLERQLAAHRRPPAESTTLSLEEEDLVTKRLRDLGYL
jgi:arylsulfatase